MNTALIARAGNDADLVESFVRHHAALVDLLVVLDEGSQDGTRAILEALRREGLPLVVVDDPEVATAPAARLTLAYRMVVGPFDPELVWLLDVGQFVRGERAVIEAELGRLPPGSMAVLERHAYVPDAATAARTTLPDPLAMITERHPAPLAGEFHGVLRRDPADDAVLVLAEIGLPARRDGAPLPAWRAEGASLACFPVRGAAQLAARLVHEWRAHRARHVGDAGARASFGPRRLLDALLLGGALTPAGVVEAALGATDPAALVRDPVPHRYEPLRHLDLVAPAALQAVIDGRDWPPAVPATTTLPTGTAMDLAPLVDLCDGLEATRAIVLAPAGWGHTLAGARPGVAQHVPGNDFGDAAVDVLFMPALPGDLLDEVMAGARAGGIRRIAGWPAEPRRAGALAAELAAWQAAGWTPDLMHTLTWRALSSYAEARRGALVLAPFDPARAERAAAVCAALVAAESAPSGWIDPPASLLLHPLQAVALRAPAAVEPVAPVAAPAAPAPTPRSVLILGAGRSGTSCLAGLFGAPSHHHADDLYAPQVSNPKGFFEAGHINDLNEAMQVQSALAHLGEDATRTLLQGFAPHQLWLGRFPDAMPAAWNDEHRRAIAQATARAPFVLKDPRMSVTAPAWLEAAPDALVLSIHRPAAVTVESILKECRTATYLLDFRISMHDAFDVWRQAYRRAVKLYREGRDVVFLRYDDLFDAARLDRLEQLVRAPLRREFADRKLNRTAPSLQVPADCAALNELLDALAVLSVDGRRAEAEAAIDRYLSRFPDRTPAAVAAPALA